MPDVAKLPARVLLCAIGYKVTCRDNMVLFASDDRCGPCYTRLMFERKCGCWYVTVESSNGQAMVSHILEATKLVEQWFGGNHKCPRGEHNL